MLKATLMDDVLNEINEASPLRLSNEGIAEVLGAPAPSVRRATRQLYLAGRVNRVVEGITYYEALPRLDTVPQVGEQL